MGKFDPRLYEVLGRLNNDASPGEIKKAYKTYAKLYHPDTTEENPEYANEMMIKLNHAYDILSNPKKREEYNQQLELHLKEEERRMLRERIAEMKRKRAQQQRTKVNSQKKSSNDTNWGALAGVGLGILALGLIIEVFSDNK